MDARQDISESKGKEEIMPELLLKFLPVTQHMPVISLILQKVS